MPKAEDYTDETIMMWDYEENISVFTHLWHTDREQPPEILEKMKKATEAVAARLREMTGFPHEITDFGECGFNISYDHMFTDEEEAKKWYGFVDRDMDEIVKEYDIIWES